MPRQARFVIPGVAHDVTQRGNNRQHVFWVPAERCAYLSYLKDSAARHGLAISAYCLMTNHIHDEWFEHMPVKEWKATLKAIPKSADATETLRGRPLGDDTFLSKMESLVGRRVRPLPIGRQKGWRRDNHPPSEKSQGGKQMVTIPIKKQRRIA